MAPYGASSGTGGLDPPFSSTYHHHPSPCQSEYPSGDQDLSQIQLNAQGDLNFSSDLSLWTPSNPPPAHSLPNSHQNSPSFAHFDLTQLQSTGLSPEWNPESSFAPDHDPGHRVGRVTFNQSFNQNWNPSPEAHPGLVCLNGGMPFAISNTSVRDLSHCDPRRVSDPSPVAPIAQRPWDPQHRYSIANIPSHEGTAAYHQHFEPARLPHDLPASYAGSSCHSGSFSTTASHLNSGDLPTPSTAGFRNEVCDEWAQLALQNFVDQAALFGSITIPPDEPSAPMDSSHQKSSSRHFKSSSLDLAPDAALSLTGGLGSSGSELDTESNEANHQTSKKRGRAGTLYETTLPYSPLPESLTLSHRARFASEYTNIFRNAGQLPFDMSPHPDRSTSPYGPSAAFPSQVDLAELSQGNTPVGDLIQHPASETPNQRETHFQQQNRGRRMTLMTLPPWPESHTAGKTIQPPPSSSFLRYQERPLCDLSSSPEKPLIGKKGRSGSLKKRKSMSNNHPSNQMAVTGELEQDLYGTERESHDMFSGPRFRETSFETEDRLSQGSGDPAGGCSQGVRSSPPHTLMRFGGIGQGPSPHPPGLTGAVRPSDVDLAGVMDETGEMMIPWKQDLRCDEDLYTPMWCRGQNDKKEGFCDMCDGGAWFRLKNSAYWYHKQYFHGVSSTTGHYFYPPKEIKRGFSTANRQQILGFCHECEQWVGYSSVIGMGAMKKNVQLRNELADEEGAGGAGPRPEWLDCDEPGTPKVPTLWFKHAHKCHRHQTCKGAKGRKKAKRG
ncbi:hypothetical protein PCANC_26053 [Puccinia coronata f. sp. avenae]|nr:hypothetical protein PCANC_26053 [Puccinia coronata f. sp. avenae]